MLIGSDLERLANILAEWATKLPIKRVYIFGSRVRRNETANSDLDVAIEFDPPPEVDATMWNWNHENDTNFAELKRALGVPLSLHCDPEDSAWPAIRAGAKKPVLSIGKVLCVITPPLSAPR
jgi:predicted nucleotidyltransferase